MKHISLLTVALAAAFGLPSLQAMPAGEAPALHSHAAKPAKSIKKGYKRVAAKKGGSGIGLQYRLLGKPAVGQPLRIAVFFDSVNSGDAKVSFKPDAQLSMNVPAQRTLTQSSAKGSNTANAQELTVTPTSEGLFYVNVFTEQSGRPSASAIAVRVGDKPLVMPTTGTVKTDANGQRIVSTPAQ